MQASAFASDSGHWLLFLAPVQRADLCAVWHPSVNSWRVMWETLHGIVFSHGTAVALFLHSATHSKFGSKAARFPFQVFWLWIYISWSCLDKAQVKVTKISLPRNTQRLLGVLFVFRVLEIKSLSYTLANAETSKRKWGSVLWNEGLRNEAWMDREHFLPTLSPCLCVDHYLPGLWIMMSVLHFVTKSLRPF